MRNINYLLAALLGLGVLADNAPAQDRSPQSKRCEAAIQGKIAWNYDGSKRWSQQNIDRLCGNAADSVQPARCFQQVMHGGVDWGGGARWQWQNAVKLCQGTRNANARVTCFQQQVGQGTGWQQAIAACRDKQPATVKAPAAEITAKPEKQVTIPDKNSELLSRDTVRQALEDKNLTTKPGDTAKPDAADSSTAHDSTTQDSRLATPGAAATPAGQLKTPLPATELSGVKLWGINETRLSALRDSIKLATPANRNTRQIAARGNDCDDADASIHPTQNEICNGRDDDCDGDIDEGVRHPAYRDKDGDRFGSADPDDRVAACPDDIDSDPRIVNNNLDCDDSNPQLQTNC